ncbi:YdeI/OmpD-associated family protein [Flavobacterium sp.]|uniref:YdeI/OmpD-associated family protein n=1 Tax=Flavobacterium sp. TaxID=239 RepID=UPI00261BE4C6|nr:YdeI/OmpD-associated family protein [Flavobacterium sp.]
MIVDKGKQQVEKLPKNKGGYFYLTVDAAIVEKLPEKKKTRLICTLDDKLVLRCGLNHMGNGNYFIIISGKHMKTLNREPGNIVQYTIETDPDPLGVEIPEVLEALLAQDDEAKKRFDAFTPGKKRTLIYSIARIKDIDKQVQTAISILNGTHSLYKR